MSLAENTLLFLFSTMGFVLPAMQA